MDTGKAGGLECAGAANLGSPPPFLVPTVTLSLHILHDGRSLAFRV